MSPDYYIIKIPDRYAWSKELQDRTKNIWSVYAFDRNSETNLCEITPSYCLMYLSVDYEPVDDLTEDQLEALHCNMNEGSATSEPVTYMHVRDVEAMIASSPELVRKSSSEFDTAECETDTERWNAEFDQLLEGWQTGALSF